jgi:WD40 repeat protein
MGIVIRLVAIVSIVAIVGLFALFTFTPLVSGVRPTQVVCVASPSRRPKHPQFSYQQLAVLAVGAGGGSIMSFGPDSKYIAAASDTNGQVAVRDTLAFQQMTTLQHSAQPDVRLVALAVSPNGAHLASAGSDHATVVWELATQRRLGQVQHSADVRKLAFSADNRWLASAAWDGHIHVVSLAAGGATPTWDLTATASNAATLIVTDIAFSPHGRWLASVSQGKLGPGVIHLWDLTTGEGKRLIEFTSAVYSTILYSADGRWLIAGTGNGAPLVVWDALTHKAVAQMPTTSGFNYLAISADSRLIAYSESTLAGTYSVRIWRTDTWTPLAEFQPGDVVWDIAFSPDGMQLAVGVGQQTGQPDGSVSGLHEAQVYDPQTGRLIARLPHPQPIEQVLRVQFSPDGCLLATGTPATLRIWQVQ